MTNSQQVTEATASYRSVSDIVTEFVIPAEAFCPKTVRLSVPAAADFVVVTVIFVVPEAVTEAGEKLALVPAGSPTTLKVTTPVNPFCGVTVTEKAAPFPRLMVFDVGNTASVKEGVLLTAGYTAPFDILFRMPALPMAST